MKNSAMDGEPCTASHSRTGKIWSAVRQTRKQNFDLHREGGHSVSRIVHHKDDTGMEIENSLLAKAKSNANIQFLINHFAVDLITKDNCCYGVTVLDEIRKELLQIQSQITFWQQAARDKFFAEHKRCCCHRRWICLGESCRSKIDEHGICSVSPDHFLFSG